MGLKPMCIILICISDSLLPLPLIRISPRQEKGKEGKKKEEEKKRRGRRKHRSLFQAIQDPFHFKEKVRNPSLSFSLYALYMYLYACC